MSQFYIFGVKRFVNFSRRIFDILVRVHVCVLFSLVDIVELAKVDGR